MTEPLTVDLSEHQELVETVVRELFDSMLKSDAWLVGDESAALKTYPVLAAVYFAGDWRGAVLLALEPGLAFSMTEMLMGVERPKQVDADVRDAIGEIAHMIAGNLKPILPGEADLSAPTVVEGADFQVNIVGPNAASRLDFASPGGALSVTLVQMREKPVR